MFVIGDGTLLERLKRGLTCTYIGMNIERKA